MLYEGPECPVYVRVAGDGTDIYLDLGASALMTEEASSELRPEGFDRAGEDGPEELQTPGRRHPR